EPSELPRNLAGQRWILAAEDHRVEVTLVASLAEALVLQQLVEDRTDGVEVDGRLARTSTQLLRGHVAELALHVQTRGLLAGETGDAEVCELDLAGDRDDH